MLTRLTGTVPVNAACMRNQKHASADSPVSVDLYDCEGLGGGGSGAAGGLLHPFTPRGKVREHPQMTSSCRQSISALILLSSCKLSDSSILCNGHVAALEGRRGRPGCNGAFGSCRGSCRTRSAAAPPDDHHARSTCVRLRLPVCSIYWHS